MVILKQGQRSIIINFQNVLVEMHQDLNFERDIKHVWNNSLMFKQKGKFMIQDGCPWLWSVNDLAMYWAVYLIWKKCNFKSRSMSLVKYPRDIFDRMKEIYWGVDGMENLWFQMATCNFESRSRSLVRYPWDIFERMLES